MTTKYNPEAVRVAEALHLPGLEYEAKIVMAAMVICTARQWSERETDLNYDEVESGIVDLVNDGRLIPEEKGKGFRLVLREHLRQ